MTHAVHVQIAEPTLSPYQNVSTPPLYSISILYSGYTPQTSHECDA